MLVQHVPPRITGNYEEIKVEVDYWTRVNFNEREPREDLVDLCGVTGHNLGVLIPPRVFRLNIWHFNSLSLSLSVSGFSIREICGIKQADLVKYAAY